MNLIKRYKIPTLLLLLLLPSVLGFSPPQQNAEDITLQVNAGFGRDHYFRVGDWTPIRVTVSSESRSINGFLQVRSRETFQGGDSGTTIYRTPITVDRRSGEVSVFVYTILSALSRDVEVELVENDGRIIQTGKSNLTPLAARDILYGVVTESVLGSIDMTQRAMGRGDSFQASWTIDDIPPEANALESLNVLTFFDVDTGRLSVEQREALRLWISSGGHLIVHSGPNWQRTTAGLETLLPTQPQGTETVDDVSAIGSYLGYPSNTLSDSGLLTQNTPAEDAQILLTVRDIPTIVRSQYGAGIVDFLAFDPLTEPFASYENLPELWLNLAANVEPHPSWAEGVVNWASAERAVRVASSFEFPSVGQLLLFLGAYVVLIGPVNYLILRQFRRYELAWISIPVLIVGFTAIAYFAGFSLRGNRPVVNQLNVVQVQPTGDIAQVDSLIGVFSPRRTTYDIEVDDRLMLRTLPGGSDNNIFFGDRAIDITQTDVHRVDDIPVDAGIVTTFAANGYTDTVDYDGAVTWSLNQNTERARITGTFSSDVALDDAVVLVKNSSAPLGKIDAGDEHQFEFNIDLQEPTWSTFGNETDYDQRFRFSGRQGRTLNFRIENDIINCQRDISFDTIAQIMQNDLARCTGIEGFTDVSLQVRMLLLQAVVNDIDFSGGRALDAYVVGWSNISPYAIDLPGTNPELKHRSLYIFRIPGSIAATEDTIRISPGLMTWTVAGRTDDTTRRDVSPYDLTVNPAERAVVRFVPFTELQKVTVTGFEINVTLAGTRSVVDLAFHNWLTGEWDTQELPPNNLATYGEDGVAAYIGPNNTIEVQIRMQSDIDFAQITSMEITMFGTLKSTT